MFLGIIQDIKKRPTAFIMMIALVFLGVQLGKWQLRRADYKTHLAAQISEKEKEAPFYANLKNWELEEVDYHQMYATGVWLADQAVWLENRTHPLGKDPKTGIATGFNLLMPLQLDTADKKILWVNRGWVPRDFNQINRVPEVVTPMGKVTVHGVVFPDGGKTLELSKQTSNPASDGKSIQENLNLAQQANEHGWSQMPFVLRETQSETLDGLDKTLPKFQSGVYTHYGYAFQWFALSVMTFLFWAITAYRKRLKSLR
jgi:cytochrome oxidase assembly protein ShyY1